MSAINKVTLIIIFILFGACSIGKQESIYNFLPSKNLLLTIRTENYNEFVSNVNNNLYYQNVFNLESTDLDVLKKLDLSLSKAYISFTQKNNNIETTIVSPLSDINSYIKDNQIFTKISNLKEQKLDSLVADRHYLYLFRFKNVFISSTSKAVMGEIENRISNHSKPKLYNLYKTSESASEPLSLFLKNTGNTLFNKQISATNFQENFTKWYCLNLDIEDNTKISFTGMSDIKTTNKSIINLFQNVLPQEHNLLDVIPDNFKELNAYAFQNISTWFRNQKAILPDQIKNVDNQWKYRFLNTHELGILNIDNKKLVVIENNNTKKLNRIFFKESRDVISYNKHNIFLLAELNLVEKIFYPLVQDFKSTYFTIIGDYIVFSENLAILKKTLDHNNQGKTLSTSPYFRTYYKKLQKESVYLKINHHKQQNSTSKKRAISFLHSKVNPNFFVFDGFHYGDNDLYVDKSTQPNQSKANEKSIDINIISDPFVFKNHITQEKDIFLQDSNNTIYLLNNKGNIYWQKQLELPILGKPIEIDLYKNNKYQLVFATKKEFFILDRNGKILKSFHKVFKVPLTQPLSVFDYDNNKDYRFVFIQNNLVSLYDGKMRRVKGWGFKSKHPIINVAKHIRSKDKDYILILEKNGRLNILYRNGKVRIPVNKNIAFSDNETYFWNNQFVVIDTLGTLYKIDTKGNLSTEVLFKNKPVQIDVTPKTIVALSHNKLKIKDKTIILKSGKYTNPKIFYIHDTLYICTTNLDEQLLYVYDSNGILFNGFPKNSSGKFILDEIDNDGKVDIITSTADDKVSIYTF